MSVVVKNMLGGRVRGKEEGGTKITFTYLVIWWKSKKIYKLSQHFAFLQFRSKANIPNSPHTGNSGSRGDPYQI